MQGWLRKNGFRLCSHERANRHRPSVLNGYTSKIDGVRVGNFYPPGDKPTLTGHICELLHWCFECEFVCLRGKRTPACFLKDTDRNTFLCKSKRTTPVYLRIPMNDSRLAKGTLLQRKEDYAIYGRYGSMMHLFVLFFLWNSIERMIMFLAFGVRWRVPASSLHQPPVFWEKRRTHRMGKSRRACLSPSAGRGVFLQASLRHRPLSLHGPGGCA